MTQRFGVKQSQVDSVIAPGKEEEKRQGVFRFGINPEDVKAAINGNGEQKPGQVSASIDSVIQNKNIQSNIDENYEQTVIDSVPDQDIPVTTSRPPNDNINTLVNKPAEQLLDDEINVMTDEEEFQVWYQGWQNQINEHYKQRDIRSTDGTLFQIGGPDGQYAPYPSEPDNLITGYDYRAAYRDDVEPTLQKHKDGKHFWHWPSKYKDNDHPNRFVSTDNYLNEYKIGLLGEQDYPTNIKKLLYDIHQETNGTMVKTERNAVAYDWLNQNGYSPGSYDPKYKRPIGSLTNSYAQRIHNMRPVNRRNDDGTESNVIFRQMDNLVYPTIFPKDPSTPSPNFDDWDELDDESAFAEAEKRGEIFEFGSEQEAKDFALSEGSGDWKNEEIDEYAPHISGPKQYKSAFAEKILAFDSLQNKWVVDPNIGYDDMQFPQYETGYWDDDQGKFVNPTVTRTVPDGWDRRTSNMTHEEHKKSIDVYDNADKTMYIPFRDETIMIDLPPPDVAGKQFELKSSDDYKNFYYRTAIKTLSKYYDLPEAYFSESDIDAYTSAHSMGLAKSYLAATNMLASSLTLGLTENLWDPSPNVDVAQKHKGLLPYSKEKGGWPSIQRSMFAVGETGIDVAKYIGPTKAFGLLKLKNIPAGYATMMRSAMVFGSVGGGHRLFDPDEREHITLDKWLVGTTLDTALGATFPFMGRFGGEVLKTPNTYRAFANYMAQTGVLTGGMTAVGFADGLYEYMRSNPSKTFSEAFKEVGNSVVDGEKLFQSFMTMAILHGTGSGSRFLRGGKAKAEEMAKLEKTIGIMWEDAPFDIKKKPTTVPEMIEYQEKYQLWVESRGNVSEYKLENNKRVRHNKEREALEEKRVINRDYTQVELDAMQWNDVWGWAKERQLDYFRHKGILYKAELKYPRPVIKTLEEATSHQQWIAKEKQKVQMELDQYNNSGRVNKNLLGERTLEAYEADLNRKLETLNTMDADVTTIVKSLGEKTETMEDPSKVLIVEDAFKEDINKVLDVPFDADLATEKPLGDNSIKVLEELMDPGKVGSPNKSGYKKEDAEVVKILTEHIKEKFEKMETGKPQIIKEIQESELFVDLKKEILGEWYGVSVEKAAGPKMKSGKEREQEIKDLGVTADKIRLGEADKISKSDNVSLYNQGKKKLWEITREEFWQTKEHKDMLPTVNPDKMDAMHLDAVKKALEEGKDVPKEVLEKYPELVPKAEGDRSLGYDIKMVGDKWEVTDPEGNVIGSFKDLEEAKAAGKDHSDMKDTGKVEWTDIGGKMKSRVQKLTSRYWIRENTRKGTPEYRVARVNHDGKTVGASITPEFKTPGEARQWLVKELAHSPEMPKEIDPMLKQEVLDYQKVNFSNPAITNMEEMMQMTRPELEKLYNATVRGGEGGPLGGYFGQRFAASELNKKKLVQSMLNWQSKSGVGEKPSKPSEPIIEQPVHIKDFRDVKDPQRRFELLRKGRMAPLEQTAGSKLTKTDNNVFTGEHSTIKILEGDKTSDGTKVLFSLAAEPTNQAQTKWLQKAIEKGLVEKTPNDWEKREGYQLTELGNKVYDQGQINKAVQAAGIIPTEYDTQVRSTEKKGLHKKTGEEIQRHESELFRVKKGKEGEEHYTSITQGNYLIFSSKGNKKLNDALNNVLERSNDMGPFKVKKNKKGKVTNSEAIALKNITPSKNNNVGNEAVIVGYSKGSYGRATYEQRHGVGGWSAWLSDGQGTVTQVQSKYINVFKQYFGEDITFRFSKTQPGKQYIDAITVYDGKGKEIGLVMPIRTSFKEAPPNMKGYLGGEHEGPAHNNPFLAKGGGGKGGLGSKQFERPDKPGSPNDQFELADLNDPVKRSEIGDDLIRNLNLDKGSNIRFKRIKQFSKKAVAIFFPKSNIIRVNSLNDLSDLSHEIGHYLDLSLFKITDGMKVKGHDQLAVQVKKMLSMPEGTSRDTKLTTLVNKYGQEAVDRWVERVEVQSELIEFLHKRNYPEIKVEEGIAEFVSDYVTNPKNAKKDAPKFFEMFEGIIQGGPVESALKQAREQITEWDALDPRVKIESTINRVGEEGWLEGIVKEVYSDSYYNLVDFTQPLRKVTDEYLKKHPDAKGHEQVLNQFLSNLGNEGKAQQFLDNHPFLVDRATGEITINEQIPGFMQTLQPWIKGGGTTLKALEGYLVAKRNIELHERGFNIVTGVNLHGAATLGLKDSKEVVRLYEEKFSGGPGSPNGLNVKETADNIYRYQDALLEYYKEGGMLSYKDIDNIRDLNKYYIPFRRYLHGEEMYNHNNPNKKYSVSKHLSERSRQAVKGIKGAKEDVISPIEQIIKNTFELINAADMNHTKKTLRDNLLQIDPSLIQQIPNKKLFITEERDPATGELLNRIYQHRKVPVEGKGIISMRQGGEVMYYEVPPDVMKAFDNLNAHTNKIIQTLALPSVLLRKGAVEYNPLFGLRNIPRDMSSSIFYSKHGYNPFHFIAGSKSYINKDINFQKFLASGAAQSYLVGMDKHLILGKNQLYSHPTYKSFKGWNPNAVNPFHWFKKFNSFTETANRVGGFVNALNKTGDVYSAMAEGRMIAADYGLRGASMRNAGTLWPFLNARIQHMKNFGIAFQKENLGRTALKGSIYFTGPQIANWMYWHSSEELADRYQEMPYWRKYGFFNVPIPGSDYTFSIPTGPFGYVFGKGPETLLNYHNDPNAGGQELLQSLASGWEQVMPVGGGGKGFATDLLPFPAQLLAENVLGYDFFTGRYIIPREMEHLTPNLQYDERTPIQLRWIGEKLGVSPARLQHLVSSVFAGAGNFTMDVVDDLSVATGVSDHRYATWTKLSDIPFMRAFTSEYPYMGKQGLSYQKMWESFDGLSEIDNTVTKWLNMEGMEAGGKTGRMALLARTDIPKQIIKFLDKGDNMAKYQWMHTPFDIEGQYDSNGAPKMTTNMKEVHKFHDLVKMIGDINQMAMQEKGYLEDEPLSVDFVQLYKNMNDQQKKEYKDNEKLISGQDIIWRNNHIITEITKTLNDSMDNGTNFEMNRGLLMVDETLKKFLYDMPMKYYKKDVKEKILQQ